VPGRGELALVGFSDLGQGVQENALIISDKVREFLRVQLHCTPEFQNSTLVSELCSESSRAAASRIAARGVSAVGSLSIFS